MSMSVHRIVYSSFKVKLVICLPQVKMIKRDVCLYIYHCNISYVHEIERRFGRFVVEFYCNEKLDLITMGYFYYNLLFQLN